MPENDWWEKEGTLKGEINYLHLNERQIKRYQIGQEIEVLVYRLNKLKQQIKLTLVVVKRWWIRSKILAITTVSQEIISNNDK